MYNAVTGYMRISGRMERLYDSAGILGFYQLSGFSEKYELSSGITLNAYSYEDLLEVCKAHNSNATLDDLKNLQVRGIFDSAVQRRK